ncbi:MAG: aldehyde ferredoxin oxidoreductase C-terminal domain-containing protein [Anaerolineae bacterium]|jgi:aldehyde:ferredoxin oxidoreductase|nr:aldehyde ferredoxin oxidoreductase C-terminal domain-containing protein [Anaerolineae bacterium]
MTENKQSLRTLAEFSYTTPAVDRGYAGQTLYVNVGSGDIQAKPVTEELKEKFVGGRGFDLWLLWHGVKDSTTWDTPENEVVISSGPCGGTTQYPGSGKSIVATISPLTNVVIDSNVGGHFGPLLKFAGWDAIEVQGKAAQEVMVYIDGPSGRVTLYEMPKGTPTDTHELGHWLLDQFAETEEDRHFLSFVTAGTGSEHTLMGCLNFSLYDRKRQDLRYKQAGRGGIGTVFRDKKVKALVVRSTAVKGDTNHPADLERIARVGAEMHDEVRRIDPTQNRMRNGGTSYLVQIMDDYDLLPVHNYRFGSHPDTPKIKGEVWEARYTQGLPDGCWYGCTVACAHAVDGYEVRTGPYKGQKVIVDGPEYETIAGCGSNCGIFEPWALLEINFYCDTYGIDTISYGTGMAFIMECYEAGVLTKEQTGGLELRFGNAEAALEVLHQMGRGEGFGKIAGLGIRRMKAYFVEHFGADPQFVQDIGMEAKGLEYSEYLTKESLAQQGGYGLTNKGPQHDEAWLIFMDQVNNQLPTFEDKAEALHYFPMWRTWFGLCGFCKLPWNDVVDPKNAKSLEPAKIPHHVQNYVEVFNGVTGRSVVKEDLITMSERVYNFQRVFNIRIGYGLRDHDAIPYRSMGPVTREEYESRTERYDKQLRELMGLDPTAMTVEEKMAAHRAYREDRYEKLIDAVYKRRGWNNNGVPTVETLRALGIDYPDVVAVVEKHLP